ncbi:MAG: cytochrome c biogenesis protein CcsA [Planctomycetaceae bacterium]|nr:cytochrome c biogenesis protein CcsA [Planctomycetaceae bacterium]
MTAISSCFSNVASAQNRFYWETIPVFDGGRTMPLSSFARQIVFEICGTTRPFIIQDTSVLAELDRVVANQRLLETTGTTTTDNTSPDENSSPIVPNIRSIDTGLGAVADMLRNAQHNAKTDRIERIPYMTGTQAAAIAERIRTLVPLQGRYFDPSELLLSWIVEPEIWEFIPIINVPENEYRQMQGFPLINNTGITLSRAAVFQIKNSDNFKQRHFELAQKQQNPSNPELSESDKITERILAAIYTFENLTFDPRKHSPDRMIEILRTAVPKSFHVADLAWNKLRTLGDNPENLQQESTHPTSTRWAEIYVAIKQLTDDFIRNDNAEQRRIPNLNTVELQFEKILKLIESNIDESSSLMQKIYPANITNNNKSKNNPTPQTQNSTAEKNPIDPESILPKLFTKQVLSENENEIRQCILAYNYSLQSLYREVEAAYISLYDNGRTLRVMPIISAQTLSDVDTDYAVNPWASIRLVLNGGERAIRRFIDPKFKMTTLPAPPADKQEKTETETTNKEKIPQEKTTQEKPPKDTPSVTSMLSIVPKETKTETNTETNTVETENKNVDAINKNETNKNTNTNESLADGENIRNDNSNAKNKSDNEDNIDIFAGADTNIYSRNQFLSEDDSLIFINEPVLSLRINVLDSLYSIFISPTRIDAATQFLQISQSVRQVIRECALRVEVYRQQLVASDDQLSVEMLNKTHYPLYEKVGTEHFYFSISPFFWMTVLALGAILFGAAAIVAAFFWRSITATVNTQVVKKISEEEAAIETGNVSVAEMSGIKSGVRSGTRSGVRSGVRSGIRSGIKSNETKSAIITTPDEDDDADTEADVNNIMESIVAPGFYSMVNSSVNSDSREDSVINTQPQNEKMAVGSNPVWHEETADYTNSTEEVMLWIGVGFLLVSIIVALIGGVMRALISGWAPVTNMYETVILMAVSAAVLGIWYTLYPLVQPALSLAWRYTEFPQFSQFKLIFGNRVASPDSSNLTSGEAAIREAAQQFGGAYIGGGMSGGMSNVGVDLVEAKIENEKRLTVIRQVWLAIPRVILMLVTFCFLMWVSYGDASGSVGWFDKFSQAMSMLDVIDLAVVLVSIFAIVWFVPRIILSLTIFLPLVLNSVSVASSLGMFSYSDRQAASASLQGRSMTSVFSGENAAAVAGGTLFDNSGEIWFKSARNKILDRKLFLIAAAIIVFLAGFFAYGNTAQLNPNFKPLTAVLRSNFWLTVHVIAIIVSYAAAFIAWSMSVIALGAVIFGRYEIKLVRGRRELKFPAMFEIFVPTVSRLIRFALLLLAVGTILGARWADYSWGRFWGWDPKEVWALITILFFAVVLHARLAKYYGRIGIVVGALFSSIAVIMTWYGINFVFKGSVHSYGGGAANAATLFLIIFITINLLWGIAAIVRYKSELNR